MCIRVTKVCTVIFVMDGQWDPTGQHRGLCVIGSFSSTIEIEGTL